MLFRQLVSLTLGTVGLATAFWITLHSGDSAESSANSNSLLSLAPLNPGDWSVTDTSLAQTSDQSEDAANVLRFSNYLYRTYRRGDMEVRLYVAYWKAGAMDPSLVWSHRPDTCWVSAGGVALESNNFMQLPGDERNRVKPGFYRMFQFPTGREAVVFWHIVGGKPTMYSAGPPPFSKRLLETVQSAVSALAGRRPSDQYVVRISTNRNIVELTQSSLWPKLIQSLASSGISEHISS